MSSTGQEPQVPQVPDHAAAVERPSGNQRGAAAVREVCPFLRDPTGSWRSAYASRDHRCSAVQPAAQLAVSKQRSLCLVPAHETCATYLLARELAQGAAPSGTDGGGAALWPDASSTPVLLEPTRGLRSSVGGRPVRTEGQALLVALMVLAFVVLVIARTASPGTTATPSPGSSAGAVGAATPSATLPPATSAAPAATPAPSPAPTASPALSVTATPATTPQPSAAQRYTVQPGDTLSGIAARFGTTVAALSAANGIADPRLIRPGQVLVIP